MLCQVNSKLRPYLGDGFPRHLWKTNLVSPNHATFLSVDESLHSVYQFYEVISATHITGEPKFHGYSELSRWFCFVLFVLVTALDIPPNDGRTQYILPFYDRNRQWE